VKADRHRLFVIDGSKALRSAIKTVCGSSMPIQRCHSHKERNVRDHLPEDQQAQVASARKAACELEADDETRKLNDLGNWLQRNHLSAAASVREGFDEMFTINQMNLSPRLRCCLGSTNIIESSFSGTWGTISRVKRWRDGGMVVRCGGHCAGTGPIVARLHGNTTVEVLQYGIIRDQVEQRCTIGLL